MSSAKRQRRMKPDKPTLWQTESNNDTLTAVTAVARTSPQLLGMSHVLQLFMDYLLDTDLGKIDLANRDGLYCVVKWLLSRCDLSNLPQACHDLRLLRGVTEAATQGNIALLELWFARFSNAVDGVFQFMIYQSAVAQGHVHLLEWLHSQGALGEDKSRSKMITSITYCRPVVVYWLHAHFPKLRLSISIENVASLPSDTGGLEFLEWLWNRKRKFTIGHKTRAQTMAASNGNIPVLSWLYEHQVGEYRMCTLESAAAHGHFEVVKWLFDRRHDKINVPCSAAIVRKDNFDIFCWLFERLDSFGVTMMDQRRHTWAIKGARVSALQGELDTLKKVYHIGGERICGPDLLTITRLGHLHILKWLLKHQKFTNFGNRMTDCAAENGHLAIVKFLCGKGKAGTEFAMNVAAANGHFEVLKLLHKHSNVGCTTYAMNKAASANRLDIVQWLHANRTEGCTTKAMDTAAGNGWMDMVQWLHNNRREGCTTTAMIDAAKNGHLKMLKWLHVNRAKDVSEQDVDANRHLWVVRYAMDGAAAHGHLEVVQWLHSTLSVECSEQTLIGAAGGGHLEVVQWLHATFLPVCDYTIVKGAAIRNGKLHVAQWFHFNICTEWTPNALYKALDSGHMTTVEWLYMEFPNEFNDWDSENFIFRTFGVYLYLLSDAKLEWIMRRFPNNKDAMEEIQRRRDRIIRPIKYDFGKNSTIDCEF